MTHARTKEAVIAAGVTLPVPLERDGALINNAIAVTAGASGVLSFRCRVLRGQYETPEAPNSIDLATRKSISFNGAPLDGIEITNAGAEAVTVAITQAPG